MPPRKKVLPKTEGYPDIATYFTRAQKARLEELRRLHSDLVDKEPVDKELSATCTEQGIHTERNYIDEINPLINRDMATSETQLTDPGLTQPEVKVADLSVLANKSSNPEINMVLDAIRAMAIGIDSKLEKIAVVDKAWQREVTEWLDKTERTVKKREEDFEGFKKSIEFMHGVATKTESQRKSIQKNFTDILTQMEADRMQIIRNQIRTEEQVNVLEREHRAFNLRVQGIVPVEGENIKDMVHKVFQKVIPDLEKTQIEYVTKISGKRRAKAGEATQVKTPPQNAVTTENEALRGPQVEGTAGPTQINQDAPILLVRFVDKVIRNKVFFEAKRNI